MEYNYNTHWLVYILTYSTHLSQDDYLLCYSNGEINGLDFQTHLLT